MELKISRQISKNTLISNFIKIGPMGTELFQKDGRMDGQTDMAKLRVAFSNFSNAPKIAKLGDKLYSINI
jgi:hypothetical protein